MWHTQRSGRQQRTRSRAFSATTCRASSARCSRARLASCERPLRVPADTVRCGQRRADTCCVCMATHAHLSAVPPVCSREHNHYILLVNSRTNPSFPPPSAPPHSVSRSTPTPCCHHMSSSRATCCPHLLGCCPHLSGVLPLSVPPPTDFSQPPAHRAAPSPTMRLHSHAKSVLWQIRQSRLYFAVEIAMALTALAALADATHQCSLCPGRAQQFDRSVFNGVEHRGCERKLAPQPQHITVHVHMMSCTAIGPTSQAVSPCRH